MAWKQVGGIWFGKNEDGTVNKKKKSIVLKKADSAELIKRLQKGDVFLTYEKPTAKLDRFLAGEHITEDEYNEKVNNLPEALAFEINLPPERD